MTRRTSRRDRGRPTKLVPEVTDRIIAAVRAGNYLETAAEHAGVDRTTIYRWQKAGAEPDADPALTDFCNALSRARAEAEARMVGCVLRDAVGGIVVKRTTRRFRNGVTEVEETLTPPNGRVALEYLSRVQPGRWGRQPVQVGGIDGAPIQVESRSVVIGVLAEKLHAVLQGQVEPPDGAGEDAAAS